jgi:hypothetical protein
MRQLELERGLDAGSHGLLLPEPSGARSIALGLHEAQRFASHCGITKQGELPN